MVSTPNRFCHRETRLGDQYIFDIPSCKQHDTQSICTLKKKNTDINSLPIELIDKVIRYCTRNDLFNIIRVSSRFYGVFKRSPFISIRDLLLRLYDGDLSFLSKPIYTEDSRLLKRIQKTINTFPVKRVKFRSRTKVTPSQPYYGRGILLFAFLDHDMQKVIFKHRYEIFREDRLLKGPYAVFCLETLAHIIETGLKSGRKQESFILSYGTIDILNLYMPTMTRFERFRIAIKNKNTDATLILLKEMLEACTFQSPVADFREVTSLLTIEHPNHLFRLMYQSSLTMKNDKLFAKYSHMYKKKSDMEDVLLKAFSKGHVYLDCWFHHFLYWVFLMDSIRLEISDYAAGDPSVWFWFPVRYYLQVKPASCPIGMFRDDRVKIDLFFKTIVDSVAKTKRFDILHTVFQNPTYQPKYYNIECLKSAILMNDLKLFKVLMSDPLLHPGDWNNTVLQTATYSIDMKFLEILLRDPRVDPTLNSNSLFWTTVERNLQAAKKCLLADVRVSRSIGNYLFQESVLRNDMDFFRWGLMQTRINPGADDSQALINCIQSTFVRVDMLIALLNHPLVDPSAQDNKAIKLASQYGHFAVVTALFKHPRFIRISIDPSHMQ